MGTQQVPWNELGGLLGSSGAGIEAPLGPQDWSDMRTLGLLATTPTRVVVEWQKLVGVVRPDGPDAVPPPRDGKTADTRLKTRFTAPLKFMAGTTPGACSGITYVAGRTPRGANCFCHGRFVAQLECMC